MVQVKPFSALRPTNDSAKDVASVPYDVVNRDEARDLAGENQSSYLHVVRSDIDFQNSVSPYDATVYAKAIENLKRLQDEGVLVQEGADSFYVYRIKAGEHEQTGVIALSSVEDYDKGLVKIHEKTRPEKLEDRTRHMIELQAHTGPVLLTFRDHDGIAEILKRSVQSEPLFDFVADDGVAHTVWSISDDSAKLGEYFSAVPASYIADGHHRAESSKLCRDKFRQDNSSHTGDESYNFFLSVLFPESELNILAYNRVVKQIPGAGKEAFLASLSEVMKVEQSDQKEPGAKGQFCMYLDGQWYGLTPIEAASTDPVDSLDCSILQDRVLGPLLAIDDPRTSSNVNFVGGIRGTAELEKLVDSGNAQVAFSLYPVTVEDLLSVADSGQTMPPKSTWFEPKLRSGVATHIFG